MSGDGSAGGNRSSNGSAVADRRKLAEIVAQKIEDRIVAEGWPVGKLLGSEPELIEEYGVSRAVLRESVLILEQHTTARMRRGPRGGLVVTVPEATALTRPVALYLEYCNVTPEQVFEIRTIIEVAAVQLAAEHITEDGIGSLRKALEAEMTVSVEEFPHVTKNIHVKIAELSGNPVLPLFVNMLTELVDARAGRQLLHVEDFTGQVHAAHTAIVEAVVRGDVGLARHRMIRHLDALMPWARLLAPSH
jgi:DNA-binding FadR family transcriptional regulator